MSDDEQDPSPEPAPLESSSLPGVPLPAELTQDDPGLLVNYIGGGSQDA